MSQPVGIVEGSSRRTSGAVVLRRRAIRRDPVAPPVHVRPVPRVFDQDDPAHGMPLAIAGDESLRQMTRERDVAWRMYLEQLDEAADAKTAHQLAEARVGALEAALRCIRDLPSNHDLLHNAMAKAMYEYAARALLGEVNRE